ncbi:hypothetical protein BDN71DRAFT_1445631 [Pleurotus eryngii]|uniref:Hydrophobin n=1 Tax=Pleurotus eryngii TaxID=5323 RepID=A0A9P6A0B2_PLEER|nr:hypothetical protein BDN71DRAFT_1445631 [Pleurotus eryngii]
MFSKATLFFTTAVAGAIPTGETTEPVTSECNTDSVQCCNIVEKAISSASLGILVLLGFLDLSTSTVPIIGGTKCNSQAVCCTGNTFIDGSAL